MVVYLYRGNAGFASDIAPDHEYHSELANRMGKAEHASSYKAGSCQWQGDIAEGIPASGAERCCGFGMTWPDGIESVNERLNDEGQGVNHGSDHQAAETERER